MGLIGYCNGQTSLMIGLAALLSISPARADQPATGTASRCIQLGGSLPCQPAITTVWVYHADGKRFADEAAAYADMLQTHPPNSVFSLTQRWGRGDRATQSLPARHDHSIEVASWKLFLHCIPRETNGACEPQLGYPGYQRARSVACPAGYHFGSDAESPYCLPNILVTPQSASAKNGSEPAPKLFSDLTPRSR